MVNNFNSIKLFLLISVLHNVNAQCGVGLKSCGNQCYSPDSYVCYSNGLLWYFYLFIFFKYLIINI